MDIKCPCGVLFAARPGQKFHSGACRKRAHRARQAESSPRPAQNGCDCWDSLETIAISNDFETIRVFALPMAEYTLEVTMRQNDAALIEKVQDAMRKVDVGLAALEQVSTLICKPLLRAGKH